MSRATGRAVNTRAGSEHQGGRRVTDAQLAVLLRQAQWALDDAAHDVPAGRVSARSRVELAGTLEALAVVLRASAPDSARHSSVSANRPPP